MDGDRWPLSYALYDIERAMIDGSEELVGREVRIPLQPRRRLVFCAPNSFFPGSEVFVHHECLCGVANCRILRLGDSTCHSEIAFSTSARPRTM
jgi:hypothetical protein